MHILSLPADKICKDHIQKTGFVRPWLPSPDSLTTSGVTASGSGTIWGVEDGLAVWTYNGNYQQGKNDEITIIQTWPKMQDTEKSNEVRIIIWSNKFKWYCNGHSGIGFLAPIFLESEIWFLAAWLELCCLEWLQWSPQPQVFDLVRCNVVEV